MNTIATRHHYGGIVTRRTKIVATIGPSSASEATLASMMGAGMDMARVSLSHSPLDEVLSLINMIATVARASDRHVGILADLPGPKLRAASFGDDGIRITDGEQVRIWDRTSGRLTSTAGHLVIDHDQACSNMTIGDRVVLGDGAIELVVVDVDGQSVVAEALTGGVARGRPGVSLSDEHALLSSPTQSDLDALRELCSAPVDVVALSLVSEAQDVRRAREIAGVNGPRIMAKIETARAVANVDALVTEADGVMVARGDLGIRCPLEDIPHIQKKVIHAGVAYGRPVITATQMLESMVHAPVPTRAEVSDVTSAVFDGTSAVMLSGETAIGKDPVRVIETMSRIAQRADDAFDSYGWGRAIGQDQAQFAPGTPTNRRITGALSAAGWRAAMDAEAAAIIACTSTGATPRAISRFRPKAPILAATPSREVARQLSVAWGITPLLVDQRPTTDGTVSTAVTAALRSGHIRPGDLVAVLVGAPDSTEPVSDTLRLLRVD